MPHEDTLLEIRPHIGVGSLRLGWTRAECRKALNGVFAEFAKGSHGTTDIFLDWVHVYYDHEDRAEYIEVSQSDELRPVLYGVEVLHDDPTKVIATVSRWAAFDKSDPELGSSYIFKPLDLSLWRPFAEDDEEDDAGGHRFMTVGVGRPGYYSCP